MPQTALLLYRQRVYTRNSKVQIKHTSIIFYWKIFTFLPSTAVFAEKKEKVYKIFSKDNLL